FPSSAASVFLCFLQSVSSVRLAAAFSLLIAPTAGSLSLNPPAIFRSMHPAFRSSAVLFLEPLRFVESSFEDQRLRLFLFRDRLKWFATRHAAVQFPSRATILPALSVVLLDQDIVVRFRLVS